MRKILVPTDFSEEAGYAFDVALKLARRTGAHIRILHVIDPPHTANFSAMGVITPPSMEEQMYVLQLMKMARNSMHELIARHQMENLSFSTDVLVGRLTRMIREEVIKEDIDLIVMGSKGASGMTEFMVGSNTEKVVRTSLCPVLTVKQPQPDFDLRNVVFASNFKEKVGPIMEHVKQLQRVFNSRLHLLYVITPGNFNATGKIRMRMKNFAEYHGLYNYTANTYNDDDEEAGILHFAREINADLIMMATHGRTGLPHLLSGSIAEDLVNHTSTPVLTYNLKTMQSRP